MKNGSYVGALKLIYEGKADLYARPESLGLDEPFLSYSKTIYQPEFRVGQVLDLSGSKEEQTSLSLMKLESSIKFLTIVFLLFTLILLAKLVKKGAYLKRLEFVTRNLFELNSSLSRSFSYLGFIVVGYSLYFNILKSILSSNINTDRVIVNTSLVVDSFDDLGALL